MTYNEALAEALAWLRGERSSWNTHAQIGDDRGLQFVRCAQEDAANTKQAYWIVRAHHEGLVPPPPGDGQIGATP